MEFCSGKPGRKKLKAQLVFEFVIAVVIFLGIVFYVLNYLNWTVIASSAESSSQYMESKAFQIGELLVMTGGNWTPAGYPVVLGLASGWPVLNFTKISWLNAYCNLDFEGFKGRLGIPEGRGLKIKVTEGSNVLADCEWGNPVSGNVTKAEVRRYGISSQSGNVVAVYVCVWSTGR